ncbi:MAG: hypothetical protein PW788_05575 [Micavibrio sp.]|nr:hypothetical protein [Micavibrio sp.]
MAARKKSANAETGGSKKRTVLLALAVMALAAGFVAAVDKDRLPSGLRDNAVTARVYHLRDRVASHFGGEAAAAPESPDANQQGYEKTDRKKLDALIGNEAGETK